MANIVYFHTLFCIRTQFLIWIGLIVLNGHTGRIYFVSKKKKNRNSFSNWFGFDYLCVPEKWNEFRQLLGLVSLFSVRTQHHFYFSLLLIQLYRNGRTRSVSFLNRKTNVSFEDFVNFGDFHHWSIWPEQVLFIEFIF